MSNPSYRELANRDWSPTGDRVAAEQWPGDARMIAGCLQRVAAALEAIQVRLDPAWRQRAREEDRNRRRKEKKNKAVVKRRQLWFDALGPARKIIECKVRVLAKHAPNPRLRNYICGWYRGLSMIILTGFSDWKSIDPPDGTADEALAIAHAFDPATFDWTRSAGLRPLLRDRLIAAQQTMCEGVRP